MRQIEQEKGLHTTTQAATIGFPDLRRAWSYRCDRRQLISLDSLGWNDLQFWLLPTAPLILCKKGFQLMGCDQLLSPLPSCLVRRVNLVFVKTKVCSCPREWTMLFVIRNNVPSHLGRSFLCDSYVRQECDSFLQLCRSLLMSWT